MKPPIDPPRPTVLDPTYARPEPWFVGNGRGLMIAVLSICAILFVARGISTVVLAEEAWTWLQRASVASSTMSPVAQPIVTLPVPAVPPRDPALANQKLRGNPGNAFDADAYPADALRNGEQGRAVAHLLIGANGVPTSCRIQIKSGSESLDRQTCRIAIARVRFEPARDARGSAIPSEYTLPVRWEIPR